jgi:hypothetical protein
LSEDTPTVCRTLLRIWPNPGHSFWIKAEAAAVPTTKLARVRAVQDAVAGELCEQDGDRVARWPGMKKLLEYARKATSLLCSALTAWAGR